MKFLTVLVTALLPCLSFALSEKNTAFIESLEGLQSKVLTGLSDENRNFIQGIKQKQLNVVKQEEKGSQIHYFVSFSIPKEGLALMINDASRFGIPSNIRGMINNDFRQTANALFDLTKEKNQGGVQINPKAFEKYAISVVPTLIVSCGETFDKVSGDIRLEGLLKKVAEKGDCADVAKQALEGAS